MVISFVLRDLGQFWLVPIKVIKMPLQNNAKKRKKTKKEKKWDYNDDNDASIKFIYCMMTLLRVRNYKGSPAARILTIELRVARHPSTNTVS